MLHARLLPELRAHLERLAEQLGPLPHPVHVHIAGSAALHLHTGIWRVGDVETRWSHRVPLPPDLQTFEIAPPDDPDDVHVVLMDGSFDSFGSYPPEWEAASLELGRTGDIIVHVINAVDLAVSALAQWEDTERDDVRILAEAGVIRASDVERRAWETFDAYTGDTSFLEHNLHEALEEIREREGRHAR